MSAAQEHSTPPTAIAHYGVVPPRDAANGIEVENLGKCYRVARESMGRMSSFLMHRLLSRRYREDLWALKDVSFNVPKGEILGIIGVNGSGKSTLLRILSGITVASRGEVRRMPKVVALLDLSAGFHPNLTGYENLFLGGSILGLRREELRERLGAIVVFSGV